MMRDKRDLCPGHVSRGVLPMRDKSCFTARRRGKIGRDEQSRQPSLPDPANARGSRIDDRFDPRRPLRQGVVHARAARSAGQLLRSRLQRLRVGEILRSDFMRGNAAYTSGRGIL